MNRKDLHYTFFTLGLLFFLGALQAQDIHYSQFNNAMLNINPGLNGVFGGDMRFAANYRNQWRTVRVPYNTFSGSVENKFYLKNGKYDRFVSGGLMVNYDKQGSLKLTSIQIGIPIALTIPVRKNHFVTLGVTPAFGQRSFSSDKLTFDRQFVDCVFDPNAPHFESLAFTSNSLKYFDFSAGFNYRIQSLTKRSKLDLGVGAFHLNRPAHNFWGFNDGTTNLRSRYSFSGNGTLQLTNNLDAVLMGLYQMQGTYREFVAGLAGRLHLNTRPNKELALQVGVGFRSRYTDALVPQAELQWRTWQLGFSYDINLSNFDIATDNKGGPELSLIYRLYRVKPLPYFKTCPII